MPLLLHVEGRLKLADLLVSRVKLPTSKRATMNMLGSTQKSAAVSKTRIVLSRPSNFIVPS